MTHTAVHVSCLVLSDHKYENITFSSKLSVVSKVDVSFTGPDNLYEYFVPLTFTHKFAGAAVLLMVQLEEKCDFGDKLMPYLIIAPMMIPV